MSKDLLLRNTAEVIKEEEVEEALQKESPTAYIGYATTGSMHIGHFTTIRKIADFIDTGFTFKILLADVHAELDIEKTRVELVEKRATYYKEAISAMLEAAGITEGYEFVLGSEFQFEESYQRGVMRMMENASVTRAKRAVNEVVRHSDAMKASALLYCFMQIQDVIALDVDVSFAGLDQRRIYMLGRELFSSLDYERELTCIFAPLLSGLSGGKMSSSDASSKVSIHDSPNDIREKVKDAYCPQAEVEDNGVLEYLKYLIFPILENDETVFTIERPEKFGGDISFDTYDELESQYVKDDVHPLDLKKATGAYLAKILEPIRNNVSQGTKDAAYPNR